MTDPNNLGEYLYGGDLEAEAAFTEYAYSNPSTYIPESTMEKFNKEVLEADANTSEPAKHSDPILGWHGFEFSGKKRGIFIGPVTGRKSVALYRSEGNRSTVLAWFKTKELAEEALALLDELADAFAITSFM